MDELLPGIEISARGLRWALVDSLPVGEQTLYRLRGLEGAFQGIEIDILSPLEEIIPIASEINPQKAAPLKNWLIYHQAFLLEQALGSTAILAIQPGRLKIEPYQIVPLMRALKMSRPRLLLCDDVGLGKTIQAAFIITELMARKFAHRVLIVSPAGPLLRQWKTELLERFGLRVEVMDRAKLEDIKKKSELGANPFDQIPLGLVSIDFLKQERILEQLERTSYDIIIIDEAHHCSDTGGTQEYEDSLRRNLAQVLANRCDTLLLLTATPHNGNDRSLASLLELLDLSLVDSKGVLRGDKYKLHMVRRLKKHIKDPMTGEPKFKERTVIPVPVEAKEDKYKYFVEFQKAFLDFIAPELRSAFRSKRYGDVLAFIALLKRSVSTVYSCLETLKTVGERFESFLDETTENQARKKERVKTLKEYYKRVEQFGTVSFEEEQDQQSLIAEDIADQLASIEREVRRGARVLTKTRSIKEAISSIIESGERALLYDPKLDALVDEIGQIKKEEPLANILIFTEYTDSQAKILERLKAENLGKILSMFGGDPEAARIKTIKQFMDENNIILVCTDAAAEGLNLHKRCHHLIHLELPFNPNRLEQRNGRIDRYGQEKIPIVRYLYLRNTFEDRILLRLIAKYERQKSKLSFVPNTLGISCATDTSCERLLKGIMDDDAKLFKETDNNFIFTKPEEDSLSDPGVKELLEEVDRSFKGFEKAAQNNAWLGEQGVNADPSLIGDASQARDEGIKLTGVDLLEFVINAVLLDGGAVRRNENIVEIELPPLWNYGLDELPGYDASRRCMLITVDIETEKDNQDNPVGFLGRSHPLISRALERVRNIGFISRGSGQQDYRATAASGDDNEFALLFTFLGSIIAKKGKLYEKVISVEIDKKGAVSPYLSPDQWLSKALPERALKTTDLWEKHFTPWGEAAREKAFAVAQEHFQPIADAFIEEKRTELRNEEKKNDDWFASRVTEITGSISKPIQYSLLEVSDTQDAPHWASIVNPLERISAFASDKRVHRAKRSEAETLMRLYKEREQKIEESLSFQDATIRPLGIMMIVPKGKANGT